MMYPVACNNQAMPACSVEQSKSLFDAAFSGFVSGTRFLKARRADFWVSGLEMAIPNGSVAGVLLAVNPYNYCTWYAKKWVQGQEPQRPDLLWIQRDPNVFPDALPEKYRHKVDDGNGNFRWDFRTARRTVWALCRINPAQQTFDVDLDNPVVFDMTSSSMFGRGDPSTFAYKWVGLRQFCMQHSTNGVMVNPSMFITQINLDMTSTVSGVVVFRPCGATGQPVWLDDDTYSKVLAAANGPLVRQLVEVQEILGEDKPKQSPQAQAFAPVSPAPKVTQPAPQAAEPKAQPSPTPPTAAPTTPPTNDSSLLARAQAAMNRAQAMASQPQQTAQPAPQVQPQAPVQPQAQSAPKDDLWAMMQQLQEK